MNNKQIVWEDKNEVIFMLGRIIDMNSTDALVAFDDGTTMDIGVVRLKKGAAVGDAVNIEPGLPKMVNEKMVDFF
jgi:hypothetical protein